MPHPHVRENLKTNESMRQGFANLCGHFAVSVKKNNDLCLPIEDRVLPELWDASEWPPHSGNFFQRGGTVYSVGSMLFEAAMNEDAQAGDEEAFAFSNDEVQKRPECRNDHEFGLVSAMCGYKRVSKIKYVDPWTGEERDHAD